MGQDMAGLASPLPLWGQPGHCLALLLSAGTGMGTGCICPFSVHVPEEQCSHTVLPQSPFALMPPIFQKLVGTEG